MKVVTFSPFMQFCETKLNQELPTIGGRAKFTLKSVQNNRLDWIVRSTGKARYSKEKWIRKYLDYYNKTASLHPIDYEKNLKATEASYLLTLIKLFIS
jgi:hypothetical protein